MARLDVDADDAGEPMTQMTPMTPRKSAELFERIGRMTGA